MFKFLKEKIGNWIKKSRAKVEERAETEQEKPEEKKKEIKKEEKQKKEKPQPRHPSPTQAKTQTPVLTPEPITNREIPQISEQETSPASFIKEEKKGFFSRLKSIISYKITKEDFDDIFEDLETALLENNVALEITERIKTGLEKELLGKEMKKNELEKEIKSALKKSIENIISEPEDVLKIIKHSKKEKPFKILFFGINGAGKTTAIAKLTNLLLKNKVSCVLAAGDTFRSASIEQLQIHADKLKVKMIKQDYGSDPSAVAYDAIAYAKKHNIDSVLIDTAGRMHTKTDLLKEMEKICRVVKPDLKIFVAEAIAGNDAVEQARAFDDAIQIDGSFLTKTDVDEKGGTIISISAVTNKPILYLGTGQEYDNIELFNKKEFIAKLGLN